MQSFSEWLNTRDPGFLIESETTDNITQATSNLSSLMNLIGKFLRWTKTGVLASALSLNAPNVWDDVVYQLGTPGNTTSQSLRDAEDALTASEQRRRKKEMELSALRATEPPAAVSTMQ